MAGQWRKILLVASGRHSNLALDIVFSTHDGKIDVSAAGWFNSSSSADFWVGEFPGTSHSTGVAVPLWTSIFGQDNLHHNIIAIKETIGSGGNVSSIYPTSLSNNYTTFIEIDGLAKITYSIFLTDLGQSIDSNILASPEKVFTFGNKTSSLTPYQADGLDNCTWA